MPAARVSPLRTPPLLLTSHETLDSTSSAESASTTSLQKSAVSPYQRILRNLSEDERWQKEIALGRRVGFYRFRGDLGSGNFSQVKVALHCLTKERVAVKILDKAKLDHKTQRMLAREISSMESLHHPHVIRLYEVIDTFSKTYLIMEFANGGELFHRISQDGKFSEQEAKALVAQVTAAIDHMHQHNIIHRDIKAENVFFAGPKTVKVGDFGFSTQVTSQEEALATFCGSPPYAAPELFKDESYIGPYVDIWALGVLIYFMVTGAMPFKAQTVAAMKKMILDGTYAIPPFLSNECQALITNLLRHTPEERYTLEQIKTSGWLRFETFPAGLPKYNVHPSSDPGSPMAPEELEARKYLVELGLTEEMMQDCCQRGARSNVTGTYRIVLHRLQAANAAVKGPLDDCEDDVEKSAPPCQKGATSKVNVTNGTKNSKSNKEPKKESSQKYKKSKMCVLL